MRVTEITVTNVGGLVDATVSLPTGPVAAFAGANGTGKSKMLAAILAPWSRVLPTPAADSPAEVRAGLALTDAERQALPQLSEAMGWGRVDVPATFTAVVRHEPLAGLRLETVPASPVLAHAFTAQEFLQRHPSLNIIYLPAERRLVPAGQTGIDLNQLSELIAWQTTAQPRTAVQNYGRLDDQEFEQFAKALCVADTLPDEGDVSESVASRISWNDFVETVNELIAPKALLPLTRQHPDELRVRTPNGDRHSVRELSSGERQALIIISRVLRAGSASNVVLIDEPDAYLHPQLSQRLMQALERGIGEHGQLIVATHSPSILDNLSPSAILRLGHGHPPRLVADEADRLDLYRAAGFRASALTQSDLLLITEGESDVALLSLLFPELGRAAIRSAGGRKRVVGEVEQLAPYELPVLGVVDRDVLAPELPDTVSDAISVWPTADIEGVFLSDDLALQAMLERGLLKSDFGSVESVRTVLRQLTDALADNVVAEIAQRQLRRAAEREWPSPRGESPLARLRQFARDLSPVAVDEVDAAIADARALWEKHEEDPWPLLRGKYVINAFAGQASEMRSGRALLEAVARTRVELAGFGDFKSKLTNRLG